jgi:hypothetical protein
VLKCEIFRPLAFIQEKNYILVCDLGSGEENSVLKNEAENLNFSIKIYPKSAKIKKLFWTFLTYPKKPFSACAQPVLIDFF